jgi:transposase-like protein
MARREARREDWRRLVALQQRSGRTVRAFCQERGINLWTFYGWRQELRRQGAKRKPASRRFIALRVKPDLAGGWPIEVAVDGAVVRVGRDADRRLVGEVIAGLRSARGC